MELISAKYMKIYDGVNWQDLLDNNIYTDKGWRGINDTYRITDGVNWYHYSNADEILNAFVMTAGLRPFNGTQQVVYYGFKIDPAELPNGVTVKTTGNGAEWAFYVNLVIKNKDTGGVIYNYSTHQAVYTADIVGKYITFDVNTGYTNSYLHADVDYTISLSSSLRTNESDTLRLNVIHPSGGIDRVSINADVKPSEVVVSAESMYMYNL